jgi:hypothetical protein
MTVSRKEWMKPNVKEKNIGQAQARKEMEWWVGGQQVGQHAWDDGQGVEDLRDGQGAQKEVHGCVESALTQDGGHDEQAAQQCEQIHQQKQQEEHQLKARKGGKANKNELSHC